MICWKDYESEIIKLKSDDPSRSSRDIANLLANKYDNASLHRPRQIRRILQRVNIVTKNTVNKGSAKILVFDLETAPLKGYMWRLWKQNIAPSQLMDSGNYMILSWSAKWLFDERMMNDTLTKKEVLREDDERITKSLWRLIDEADIIVAHNGNRFDIPMMNGRFFLHGMKPPSPYISIDTKYHSAKRFNFPSNKLDYIAEQLGVGRKIKTDFELWENCLHGDTEALRKMQEYNDMDVEVLEEVYIQMRPWIKPHPNVNLYVDNEVEKCPTCGHDHLEDAGIYATYVNTYQAKRCKACGSISRERKNNSTPNNKKNIMSSVPK